MKAVVAAFNQEKALVGAFSVITNLRMELFEALIPTLRWPGSRPAEQDGGPEPRRLAGVPQQAVPLHPGPDQVSILLPVTLTIPVQPGRHGGDV